MKKGRVEKKMSIEYFGDERAQKSKRRTKKIMIFVVMIFMGILGFIIFSSFSDNINLTGGFLTGDTISSSTLGDSLNGIKINTEIEVPNISVNGKFSNVEMSGKSESLFKVGSQTLSLNDLNNNFISIANFDGGISFDKKEINSLIGKVSEVTMNGATITPSKQTTISFNKPFNYNSLKISNTVSIGKISYPTSGTIFLNDGKESFTLDNETLMLKNFRGNVSVNNGKFIMNGYIDEISIIGKTNIDIKKP